MPTHNDLSTEVLNQIRDLNIEQNLASSNFSSCPYKGEDKGSLTLNLNPFLIDLPPGEEFVKNVTNKEFWEEMESDSLYA